MSDAYRLTFWLPQALMLLVPEGRHRPCVQGVVLQVDRGVVTMTGGSREALFEQTRRFFEVHARKLPARSIEAIFETPRDAPGGPAADNYTITINSRVTIAPSTIEPDIDRAPQLTIMSAG